MSTSIKWALCYVRPNYWKLAIWLLWTIAVIAIVFTTCSCSGSYPTTECKIDAPDASTGDRDEECILPLKR